MSRNGIVIVGAGQASAVATRTLRRRGFDGPITIVGDETERPYQRPPLSKDYLVKGDESDLFLLPEGWTAGHDVEVRTGVRATGIDARAGAVQLADGSQLAADKVLIATGGRPRRFPDAEGDRVRYLRSKADADALREHLSPGVRLIVVGAGFIGAEVAGSARALGAQVTLLEAAELPLIGLLGSELATACSRRHEEAGVHLHCGVAVSSISQHGEEVVVTTEAGRFAGDLVVVGIGILPNVGVATDAGIAVDNGILVDEFCRTSMANVYAAGDVANHYHPLFETRMRVEHFDNASKQAAAAANNMIGRETSFRDSHWFWSDQYGVNYQHVGHASGGESVLVRGSVEDPEWSAFFLRDGIVRAAFAVDRAEDIMVARELIESRHRVPPGVLADPTVDLIELLEQG